MDMNKFKDLEIKFHALKKKGEKGEIDSSTINKELKKLMIMDDKGSYWIIGGNSGKWYKYNGKDWQESDPYKTEALSEKDNSLNNTTKIIKNDIGLEKTKTIESKSSDDKANIINDDEVMVICKSCKGKIDKHELYCHICGANQNEKNPVQKSQTSGTIPELLISSVNLISLIFFFGGIGIIIGVILGAMVGIFKDLPTYIELPQMLTDLRSNILGGILFAILGGIAGFIIFAIKAVFIGSLYNMISYFFGGIRFRTKK